MEITETLQVTKQTIQEVPMLVSIGIVIVVVAIVAIDIIRKKKK